MQRDKVVRGLRIAWTAAFGILCVLLIVLWVRSYWVWDHPYFSIGSQRTIFFSSVWGRLNMNIQPIPYPDSVSFGPHGEGPDPLAPWFEYYRDQGYFLLIVPHFCYVLLTGVLAVLPWLTFSRFSLRTLLIATTLAAVLLGLTAWLTGWR